MSDHIVGKIDIEESNWGLGPHRNMDRKAREAWHEMYERETGEKTTCNCLEADSVSGLRDQLAERLSLLSGLEYTDDYPGTGVFRTLADECIRQMEWARHAWHSSVGCVCYCCGEPPRTLAPEDWKP